MRETSEGSFESWTGEDLVRAADAGLVAVIKDGAVRFRPKGARVLVRLDEKISHWDQHGERRIIIPDAYQRQPVIGTVLAVGLGKVDDRGNHFSLLGLKAGERVYIGPWNGIPVELDDEHEYRVCMTYNYDPNLQQEHVQEAMHEPETQFVDVYCVIENDDGTPYEGTPSREEVRAWLNQVMD